MANTYFDTKQPAKRDKARAALKGARSLAQAVERAGLLKGAPSAAAEQFGVGGLPHGTEAQHVPAQAGGDREHRGDD